jgi:hypothetical protein
MIVSEFGLLTVALFIRTTRRCTEGHNEMDREKMDWIHIAQNRDGQAL